MRDEPTARRMIWAFLGLLIVIGGFWIATSNRFTPADGGDQIADIGPQTLAQLTSMGKPGIVEFYVSNCSWCAKMLPELAKIEKQYGANLFVVKMSAEKYPAEASKYSIQAFPTVVYFDAKGKVAETITGYEPAAEVIARLRSLKMVE